MLCKYLINVLIQPLFQCVTACWSCDTTAEKMSTELKLMQTLKPQVHKSYKNCFSPWAELVSTSLVLCHGPVYVLAMDWYLKQLILQSSLLFFEFTWAHILSITNWYIVCTRKNPTACICQEEIRQSLTMHSTLAPLLHLKSEILSYFPISSQATV